MSDVEKILFLERPVHKNSFPKSIFDDEVLNSIVVTFDGTIMGVSYDAIESDFNSEESRMVRLGMKKPPKGFKISDKESFYRYLSFQKSSF